MDCKCGIVVEINTYPANEKESLVVLRHLENQILSGVSIKRVALDRGYDTGAVHRGLELGITGYIPGIQFPNSSEKFRFSYDQQRDSFVCSKRQRLVYHRLNCNKSTGKYLRCYQVTGNICLECE